MTLGADLPAKKNYNTQPHWAWQPVAAVTLPAARPGAEKSNPVDAFLDDALQAALKGTGTSCPAVDRGLLKTYLTYFERTGFIEPAPIGRGT